VSVRGFPLKQTLNYAPGKNFRLFEVKGVGMLERVLVGFGRELLRSWSRTMDDILRFSETVQHDSAVDAWFRERRKRVS
jgi:hypothetical protein